jgi:hypothetical protein
MQALVYATMPHTFKHFAGGRRLLSTGPRHIQKVRQSSFLEVVEE